jgi:hypothetical protein
VTRYAKLCDESPDRLRARESIALEPSRLLEQLSAEAGDGLNVRILAGPGEWPEVAAATLVAALAGGAISAGVACSIRRVGTGYHVLAVAVGTTAAAEEPRGERAFVAAVERLASRAGMAGLCIGPDRVVEVPA